MTTADSKADADGVTPSLGTGDYPLAERRPDLVRSAGGRSLDALTLEAVTAGTQQNARAPDVAIGLTDFAVTPRALRQQAEIARAAGRPTLAANFERAAELNGLPQDLILAIYEKLRPGRAKDKAELVDLAADLRRDHDAPSLCAFIEEAADVYERRGLFSFRF